MKTCSEPNSLACGGGKVPRLLMLARFSTSALCAWLALSAVLCASLCHLPVKGRSTEPTPPGKSVGRPGCGPPISYQVFHKDAFGADWSKANELLAYNAKGGDGRYHIYTVKPDGTNPAQFGLGAANFPQRTTGSPVWSPSGKFVAFVAEKPAPPGNSVPATPGWGSYSDLWVASADGSHAWQLTDVPTDKDHGTIIAEFSPGWPAAGVDRAHQVPEVPEPDPLCRILGDQGRRLQRRPRRHAVAVRHPDRVAPPATPSTRPADSPPIHRLWCSPATSKPTTSGTTRSTASTPVRCDHPTHPGQQL